jgi:hypothetical protein
MEIGPKSLMVAQRYPDYVISLANKGLTVLSECLESLLPIDPPVGE